MVPTYLVETYEPDREGAIEDATASAQRAERLGDDVHYLRTTFLPEDEVVLHAFQAPSREALRAAAQRAALQYERIVETVEGGRA